MTDDPLLRALLSNEDLHADLEPYVTEEHGMLMLRHPLVYSVPYSPQMAGLLNEQYRYKLSALENADPKTHVVLHEKPWRLHAFLEVEDRLDNADYWSLLGDIWTGSENIWQNLNEWEKALRSNRADRHLIMDEDERQGLADLDTAFTVYRGGTPDGLSWTLSLEKARWFAKRFTNEGCNDVWSTQVLKKNVVAFFTRRGEDEIVMLRKSSIRRVK